MPKTIDTRTAYMEEAHNSNRVIAKAARRCLGNVDFDTMVGTGLSGSLIIPRLAEMLKKNWLIVRKENDGTHSSRLAEGSLGERYIFVDDLIDSGATRKHVLATVKQVIASHDRWALEPHPCKYVGDYYYSMCNSGGIGFTAAEDIDY